MADIDQLGLMVEADVLVVGGGFAGLWAAIRARDYARNVILVEKAKVGRSGCSTFASGVQLCPTTADDLDIWKKEIVEAGNYFSDQDWVEFFLQNQIERIKDYERWGAPFERDEKGSIARIVGRGHINTRLFQFHGPKLMGTLREQALKKGVKLIERVMITDLLTFNGADPTKGRVAGAVGIGTRTAQFHIFNAGAVILAAGPIGSKRSNVDDVDTGDGVAAAFRAGAEVTNMEFCTTGNINVWERRACVGGINMIQGHGARIVNARNERFMEKYDPQLMERSSLHKLCMAFAKEALEGRGPIFVDMRDFTPATFEKFRRVIPRNMQVWDSLGIHPAEQRVECTPSWALHAASGEGGLKIDINCATNIPGLYAAGAVTRNPVHGIYTVGGISTASCNVTGFVAGENAGKYSKQNGCDEIDPGQVAQLKEAVLIPLRRRVGPMPSELFARLDKFVVPARFSMFKNAARIIQALSMIDKMKEELPLVAATDEHELVKAHEFKNYMLCAELIFRAALERKESRHFHYREDYPYTDDMEWLKLIVFKRNENGMAVRHESIPLEKWDVKPKMEGKISHPIQMFLSD